MPMAHSYYIGYEKLLRGAFCFHARWLVKRSNAIGADKFPHARYHRVLKVGVLTCLAHGVVVTAQKEPFASDYGAFTALCALSHWRGVVLPYSSNARDYTG